MTRKAKAAAQTNKVGRSKAQPEESKTKPTRKSTRFAVPDEEQGEELSSEEEEEDELHEEEIGPVKGDQTKVVNKGKLKAGAETRHGNEPYGLVPIRPTTPLGRENLKNKALALDKPEIESDLPDLTRKGPAFRQEAPIHEKEALNNLLDQIKDLVLPIKFRSLVSVSPSVVPVVD